MSLLRSRPLFALLLAVCASPALAAMQARPVEWNVGQDRFSGVLVYDDAGKAPRPGLVMVPDWKGVTDSAVAKARHVAGGRYVVLVADMYGKGVRPKTDEEALAQVKRLYADRSVLRARAAKALEVLKSQPRAVPLDRTRVAALGYCFGGTTVLELARSGADLAAVVSFHGGLDTSMPAAPGAIKASVLVLNGADDANTRKDVPGFVEEMRGARADWQFVELGGAVHCFALPEARKPPNCVYDERATRRGERIMQGLLDERFGDARTDGARVSSGQPRR